MLLVEIGTATAISAYFYMHITSGYGLNVSDPTEGQPIQLLDYLFVFGCELVFWLLVLLRAKLHGSGDRQADIRKVAKLAKLIAPITTLNLCGCLLAPFMKLPLLVRLFVLFQVSSNLALLLVWAFLSLKECMIVRVRWNCAPILNAMDLDEDFIVSGKDGMIRERLIDTDDESFIVKGKDEISWERLRGTDYAPTIKGASGSQVNIVRCGGNHGGGGAGGGGERGASGSGHGSGASGSGGGREGGDRGRDGDGADLERGGRGTNTKQAFESFEIIKMSLALTAQTTGTLMGFHLIPIPSSSSKVLLVVALMDQLVAFLCGVTGILLSSNEPEDLNAAKIFAGMGFFCYTSGYILMIAMYVVMFVPWYSVLIVVLLFGVVWLILFRNGLKTRATEVWIYLKNSTESIKNYIRMLFESGS